MTPQEKKAATDAKKAETKRKVNEKAVAEAQKKASAARGRALLGEAAYDQIERQAQQKYNVNRGTPDDAMDEE